MRSVAASASCAMMVNVCEEFSPSGGLVSNVSENAVSNGRVCLPDS
jgi:hypothetical protein